MTENSQNTILSRIHIMETKLKIYTSLFDIGRDKADGRSIAIYKDWLEKTVRIFPGMTIYHNGVFKDFNVDAQLIHLELEDLKFYRMLSNVTRVIKNMKIQAKNDITFSLPAYSLIQLSKFEIANSLWDVNRGTSLLWVDAGISRFIKKSSITLDNVYQSGNSLESAGYDGCFEIDLHRNINYANLRIHKSKFGTCRRVISGTSFWLNSSSINKIYEDLYSYCLEILDQNLWDNEQIILRNLFPKTRYNLNYRIQKKQDTGSVARDMGSESFKLNHKVSLIINNRLQD